MEFGGVLGLELPDAPSEQPSNDQSGLQQLLTEPTVIGIIAGAVVVVAVVSVSFFVVALVSLVNKSNSVGHTRPADYIGVPAEDGTNFVTNWHAMTDHTRAPSAFSNRGINDTRL